MIVVIIIVVVVVLLLLFVVAQVQRPRQGAEPGRQRLVADRRAAQAPLRPDPEPRRDGQGLRRPRAGHVRGRHRRRAPTRSTRSRRARRAAGPGRERAHRRAEEPVRGGRGLPGPQGQPELPEPAGGAHLDRGPIAYARQFYNDSVLGYNNADPDVPDGTSLAGMFNFEKREFFDGEPEDTGPVKVQF